MTTETPLGPSTAFDSSVVASMLSMVATQVLSGRSTVEGFHSSFSDDNLSGSILIRFDRVDGGDE